MVCVADNCVLYKHIWLCFIVLPDNIVGERLGGARSAALRGFSLHGRGGVTLSGKVLITYTDACTKHKQEARHGRQRGDDSHKSQVALTPAELAPDVQQYDEGDEQQAQHEDGSRATAQRKPQPLRNGRASAGAAASTLTGL